ncbi:MAG: LPS export ABC transporter periplasmic protein LptC [Cyanobacteria bacterium P01_F01_bin.53]
MNKQRWYRFIAVAAMVLILVISLRTCGIGRQLAEVDPGEEIDAELTLQTVILEQPDEDGTLLWRLKAKNVTYTPDNQRAELSELDGEFFQEGQTVYTVTADEGEVQQNGETLFLRGNLVATSVTSELTLEGEKLKWQPKQDLLVMGAFEDGDFQDSEPAEIESDDAPGDNEFSADESVNSSLLSSEDLRNGDVVTELPETPLDGADLDGADLERALAELLSDDKTADKLSSEKVDNAPVVGFNPQMEAIAQVIRVSNKDNQVRLRGGVVAKSKDAPWLTFESERLNWFTAREVIEAEQPLKVEQYEGEDYDAVTDRIVGATGEVQLADNVVTLDDSVQLESSAQSLKVVSERAVWDVPGQRVVLDQPVDIEQAEEKITASADQATLDLAEELIVLDGNVKAKGEEKDSRLAADRVRWQTASQDVEAEGNVTYQQAADPEISMAGSQAFGNLEQGTVVVLGGESGEVVTEFVPGEAL